MTFLFNLLLIVLVGLPAALGALLSGWFVVDELSRAARGVLGRDSPVDHLTGYAPVAKSGRDPAYRSYLLGPVLQDVRELVFTAAAKAWSRTMAASDQHALVRELYEWWTNVEKPAPKVLLFPPLVGAEIGVVAGYGVASLVVELVLLVFAVVVGVASTLAGLAMVVLRVLETLALRVRGITVECGNCHHRVVEPAYDCPRCSARHRRLIPGRLGVLRRTCRCGRGLATLLLFGKWKLAAFCQRDGCHHALPADALTTTTFHAPIVAGTSAGKTVFMLAAVADLEAGAGALAFADEVRAEEVRRMLAAVRGDGIGAVPGTLPDAPPRPLIFRLGSRARRLVYLYDAAGEHYQDRDRREVLRSLQFTEGVVFIVDPFALDAVGAAAEAATLARAHPSKTDPTETAQEFTSELRARLNLSSGPRIQVAAAVVVTKCDALVAERSIRHPYDDLDADTGRDARSAAVRVWLAEYGADQIVAHLDNNYRRTSFFAVSGLDPFEDPVRTSARTGAEVRNDPPAAPVRWLLDPKEDP